MDQKVLGHGGHLTVVSCSYGCGAAEIRNQSYFTEIIALVKELDELLTLRDADEVVLLLDDLGDEILPLVIWVDFFLFISFQTSFLPHFDELS